MRLLLLSCINFHSLSRSIVLPLRRSFLGLLMAADDARSTEDLNRLGYFGFASYQSLLGCFLHMLKLDFICELI